VGVAVSRFRTKVQPFFFRAGILEAGDPVKISQIEEHLPVWRTRLEAGSTIAADDRTRQWQCGLMATHIFRADQKTLAWMPLRADATVWLEAATLLQSPAAPES
jgi:hypothetical protein